MRSVHQNGYVDAYYYKDLSEYFFIHKHEKCNDFFKKKLADCNIENLDRNLDFHFYIFDWNILVKYNQIIFSIILNPLFGLICIGLNILTIMILSNKHIDDKKKMYSDLKMNSIFMLVFNVISLFKVIYVCMNKSNWNDAKLFIDFCLEELELGIGRYFNIILIKFLSNSFKTGSNIYYALFTINRFFQTTESKNTYLSRIYKVSFIKKMFATIIISLVVNVYSYFQYSNYNSIDITSMKLRYIYSYSFGYLNSSKISHLNELNDYTQELNNSTLIILQIFNIIKIIFSDIFFSCLAFVFDILLFIFVKKNIDKKREVIEIMLTNTRKSYKKLKKSNSVKTRISSMIILFDLLH